MCGICGILHQDPAHPVGLRLLHAMTDIIIHRGPDDDGYHVGPGIGLGMRRLSIIDVDGGAQPIHNEDGSICVVYNGEIYNYPDLRRNLESSGHVFRTRTDTEVLVHAYEEYGDGFVAHLNGMFALAMWDARERRLLLARDRLGQKPLYFCKLPDKFIFGSELKCLLLDDAVSRELDWGALDQYLAYGYIVAPRTVFRAIRKLPQAHLLVVTDGEVNIRPYWQIDVTEDDPRPEDELVDELRALLSDVVRIRLMSDVPLGAFLSGGLDSSTVVAWMSQHMCQPVKTFSIGFEEGDFDELNHARTIARHFQTDHHEFIVRPNILQDLSHIIWQFDEPFADSSALPTFYVSQMARRYVKVALTGDGGDESFGGYSRYLEVRREARWDVLPSIIRRATLGVLSRSLPYGTPGKNISRRISLPADARYAEAMSMFASDARQRLYTSRMQAMVAESETNQSYARAFGNSSNTTDVIARAQNSDLHIYLPEDILVKVDRMSMLNSLETRAPLLDYRLVEFMARVPTRWKVRGNETKYLLRRAMEHLLPEKILRRGKRGFGVPLSYWFRGDLNRYVWDVLADRRARQRGIINPNFVDKLLRQHQRGIANHYHRIWILLVLELWFRTYVDGEEWRHTPPKSAYRLGQQPSEGS